jgi:hypothetical protein
MNRDDLLRKFVSMQYARNDMDFHRGTFRVRGDTVEIIPMYEELAIRIEFFGDEMENIYTLHPLTGEVIRDEEEMYVFPASHYVAGPRSGWTRAIKSIEDELAAGWPTGGPEQARGGPAAADAHHLRPRDDAADGLLQRHRELLIGTLTAAAPARPRTASSTTSRTTSCWWWTNPT